ncbi:unnamed protein product [Strongylus vulgaris]|uniref:Uncharacterized protein n=1 Tax=Strongylus vulgaris TaxID=40348 RepID=A0A3P7KVU7_STRVU|nr:unnamed protein product [Strongylus vulgaris]
MTILYSLQAIMMTEEYMYLDCIPLYGLNGIERNHFQEPKITRCLLVGDFFNFGANETAYDQEKDFLSELAYNLYEKAHVSSLGLWLYGHTLSFTNLNDSIKNMRQSPIDFLEDVFNVQYQAVEKPLDTADAILQLNKLVDVENRINCIAFISAL